MFFKKKKSHKNLYLTFVAFAGLATGLLYFPKVNAANKTSTKKDYSQSDFDAKVKRFLEKNPQIIIDIIAKNYDQFTKSIQEHMARSEKEMMQKIEQNIQKESNHILNYGVITTADKTIQISNYKQDHLRLALFFDPMCPHCHKLSDMLPDFLKKAQEKNLNVAINLIPVGVLDEKNSKPLARIFLSVSRLYSAQKGLELIKNVIDFATKEAQSKKQEPIFTREIITQQGQKLGIDMKMVEKIELESGKNSPTHHVEEATKIFTRIEYPGVPILIGRHKDNKFSIMSIQNPEDFSYIVSLLRYGKSEAEKFAKSSHSKKDFAENKTNKDDTEETEEN